MLSRQRKYLAVLLAVAVLSSACFDSKTVVTKIKPAELGSTNGKMNGVFYALPRTVVSVSVPLVRKDYFRGKFHKYAAVFFPDDDIKFPDDDTKPGPPENLPDNVTHVTKFAVKPAVFDSRGEPDPDEIYMVSVQGGRFETKSLLLDLTDEGVLSRTKAESKDDTLEFVTGAIKTGAGIVSQLIPFASVANVAASNEQPLAKAISAEPVLERDTNPPSDAQFLAKLNAPQADQNKARANAEERIFYEGLTSDEEKLFYRMLGQKERDFYRIKLTAASERTFYRSLSPEEAAFFRALPLRERNSYAKLGKRAEREFFANELTRPVERDLFVSLTEAQRAVYMRLTEEQSRLFAIMTPAQMTFLTTLPEDKWTDFFEAKRIHDKIQQFIKQRDDLLSLAARSSLPPETLKRLLEELDEIISSMKETYFLGIEATTENTIGTFQYAPPSNMRLAVGRPYSMNEIADYLKQAGFTASAGGGAGTFNANAGGVVIHTRNRPMATVVITSDAAGNITSINGGSSQEFELNPETIGDFTMPLFTFFGDKGICSVVADGQGVKAPPKFEGKCPPAEPTIRTITLVLAPGKDGKGGRQPYDSIKSARLDDGGERSFSYRYPAMYLARVESKGLVSQPPAAGEDLPVLLEKTVEHGRSPVTVAQLGLTVSLPATTKGRRTSYELALYEKSGALKNFNMGSDAAIQKSILDDLGGAATTIIEAEGERRKTRREKEEEQRQSEAAASDEVNILEREKKILELRKEIEKLKKELQQPQP